MKLKPHRVTTCVDFFTDHASGTAAGDLARLLEIPKLLPLEILRVCCSVQNVRVQSFHAKTTVFWHFSFCGTNHGSLNKGAISRRIPVGDVEITVVDDISIGDDSPSAACPLVETVREPAKASTVKRHAVTSSCRRKNG
jgi:hypothetical protein